LASVTLIGPPFSAIPISLSSSACHVGGTAKC
jgi:hypothetical protein